MLVDAGLCHTKDKALISVITGIARGLVGVCRFVLIRGLLLWEQRVPGSNPGAPIVEDEALQGLLALWGFVDSKDQNQRARCVRAGDGSDLSGDGR